MTLDEAIKHAEEVSGEQLMRAGKCTGDDSLCDKYSNCMKCAEEHRQLAEWLRELKAYRERVPSYEAGYNDAKREIALSGEYKRAYDRGYEQACKDKIDIPYKEAQDADSD